jgi:hypothetical protein
LDRTQPGLPMKKGRCGTMTHDDKRNRTTTLFAALELAQGIVVRECYQRHRHQQFLKFLRRLKQEFPGPVPLHLVMDNCGTHNQRNRYRETIPCLEALKATSYSRVDALTLSWPRF